MYFTNDEIKDIEANIIETKEYKNTSIIGHKEDKMNEIFATIIEMKDTYLKYYSLACDRYNEISTEAIKSQRDDLYQETLSDIKKDIAYWDSSASTLNCVIDLFEKNN